MSEIVVSEFTCSATESEGSVFSDSHSDFSPL